MNRVGNWFSSTQRRVKEGLRQAVGTSQATDDSLFDERIKEWEANINDIKKVRDAIEIFLDALTTVSNAGAVLCDTLTKHYAVASDQVDNPFKDIVRLFENVNADINNIIQPAVRSSIMNRCIRPIQTILSQISPIYEKIGRRKSILLDFDAYKTKVHKESMASNPHLEKTMQKLADTSKELALVQADILVSLGEFDDSFPKMLGNEITALVASLYYYTSSSAVLMSQMLPYLPQSASTLCLLSIATASSSLLTSPSLVEQMEKEKRLKPVNPVLARSDVEGGTAGEYGALGLPLPMPSDDRDDVPTSFSDEGELQWSADVKETSLCDVDNSSSDGLAPEASVPDGATHADGSRNTECITEEAHLYAAEPALPVKPVRPDRPGPGGPGARPSSTRSIFGATDIAGAASVPQRPQSDRFDIRAMIDEKRQEQISTSGLRLSMDGQQRHPDPDQQQREVEEKAVTEGSEPTQAMGALQGKAEENRMASLHEKTAASVSASVSASGYCSSSFAGKGVHVTATAGGESNSAVVAADPGEISGGGGGGGGDAAGPSDESRRHQQLLQQQQFHPEHEVKTCNDSGGINESTFQNSASAPLSDDGIQTLALAPDVADIVGEH